MAGLELKAAWAQGMVGFLLFGRTGPATFDAAVCFL